MSIRLPYSIGNWTKSQVIWNLNPVQIVAKLCVGAVQDWITLELIIRIRITKVDSDISKAAKTNLRRASAVLITVITLSFVAFAVTDIALAH